MYKDKKDKFAALKAKMMKGKIKDNKKEESAEKKSGTDNSKEEKSEK